MDIIYLLAIVAFGAAIAGLAIGCERLQSRPVQR
jgi:hypothetical protein